MTLPLPLPPPPPPPPPPPDTHEAANAATLPATRGPPTLRSCSVVRTATPRGGADDVASPRPAARRRREAGQHLRGLPSSSATRRLDCRPRRRIRPWRPGPLRRPPVSSCWYCCHCCCSKVPWSSGALPWMPWMPWMPSCSSFLLSGRSKRFRQARKQGSTKDLDLENHGEQNGQERCSRSPSGIVGVLLLLLLLLFVILPLHEATSRPDVNGGTAFNAVYRSAQTTTAPAIATTITAAEPGILGDEQRGLDAPFGQP